jgi:hypothetical protein
MFDFPDHMAFQLTDDSFDRYAASIVMSNQTIKLTKSDASKSEAHFHFERTAKDLRLYGEVEGRRVQLRLQPIDPNKLTLLRSGFHWIQEY